MTELPNLNVIITDRLLLRPLLPTDADAIYTLRSDPQIIASCLTHKRAETGAGFDARLKRELEIGEYVGHCVELRVSAQREGEKTEANEQRPTQYQGNKPDSVDGKQGESRVIGLVGTHGVPEIGYMFLPEHWGKGYATEALKAWMNWYWMKYPGGHEEREYLQAVTGPDSGGSQNVLKKCGFTWRVRFQHFFEEEMEEEEDESKRHVMLDIWKVERPRLKRMSWPSS